MEIDPAPNASVDLHMSTTNLVFLALLISSSSQPAATLFPPSEPPVDSEGTRWTLTLGGAPSTVPGSRVVEQGSCENFVKKRGFFASMVAEPPVGGEHGQ